jgi:AcrR family transcriptional regulator
MTRNKAKDLRVEEIVHAAVEEFLDKGYEKASMEGIALRSGLSKGGLYHHFGSKDEILIYVVKKINEPLYKLFNRVSAEGSAISALEMYIEEYMQFWINNPKHVIFYFISMVKAFQDRNLTEIYMGFTEELIPFLELILNRGMEKGEFKEHNSYIRALALQSAMDGMMGYMMFDPSLNREEIISGFRDVFINDLLKPGMNKS